jgi:predicted ATP-binding protein involved in virulence
MLTTEEGSATESAATRHRNRQRSRRVEHRSTAYEQPSSGCSSSKIRPGRIVIARIAQIKVHGLFGQTDHVVDPNGAGKTHVLRLTAAVLALETNILLQAHYSGITISFTDGRALKVKREAREDGRVDVSMNATPNPTKVAPLRITSDDVEEPSGRSIPSSLKELGPDQWVSERTGRTYSAEDMARRFGASVNPLKMKLRRNSLVQELVSAPSPIFIDTWRLDARSGERGFLGDWGRRSQRADAGAARIRDYTDRLRGEISEARRKSISSTQSADLSFATRALDAATLRVKPAELHERYDRTVERYEALARNGLAVGDAPIPFPESATPTVRRILSVFLDDWDQRLAPLLPVNEKLQVLREILDSKLQPSGKKTSISSRGGLEFYAGDRRLPVARLSSGEQHLVALFTLLLFAAQPGSLVLIDEPEISLHAAWKHAFLDDISRVAEVNRLQVILATHSAGIVNGRWDLVEELKLSPVAESIVHDDESEVEDEDYLDG